MAEPGENENGKERSGFPAAFAVGIVIMLVLAGGLVLLSRATRSHLPGAGQKPPFGPTEQAYALQIRFQSGEMSQSSNLLNQEFTYVAGTVTNAGNRTLRALNVNFEFHDPFRQVVLRDAQILIDPAGKPLGPGQSRTFQVTLGAHLPSEWNREYPLIRITGMILE
ncbi:MAG TPA: FxLYD domain-containing protein [Candidatus Acidoferrales bacterium]|nr:FxLYD domain-containing protein [Candidatus Acidoferrales bacterium]